MKNLSLLFALIIVNASFLNAQDQLNKYQFTQFNSPYTSISAVGTALFTAAWDDNVQAVTLPFSFQFKELTYSTVQISSNGFVTFGTLAPATTNYSAISSAPAYDGAISAFSTDLAANGSPMYTHTLGTAPNRIFVIEWKDASPIIFPIPPGANDKMNFQIRLYETTNDIEIKYGACAIAANFPGQIGLRGSSNSYFLNRRPGTSFNNTFYGEFRTNSVEISSTNAPASGLTFKYQFCSTCTTKYWAGYGSSLTGAPTVDNAANVDINNAANWSSTGPYGPITATSVPTSVDSVVIYGNGVLTMSTNHTWKSLTLISQYFGNGSTTLSVGTNTLQIQQTLTLDMMAQGSSTYYVGISVGTNATSTGKLIVNGKTNIGSQSETGGTFATLNGSGSPNTSIEFYDDVTFGTAGAFGSLGQPGKVSFLKPGNQTLTINNVGALPVNSARFSFLEIGDGTNPTVLSLSGSGNPIMTGTYAAGSNAVLVKSASTLNLASKTLNFPTATANANLNLESNSQLRLSGSNGGQTGSNFPNNFGGYQMNPTSNVEFYGAGSQTIPALKFGVITSTAAGARVLANADTVRVTGASFVSGTNTYTTTGSTLCFEGSGAQNITGNLGNTTNALNNLAIKNTGTGSTDGLVLSQNLHTNGNVSLINGYLRLNGFTLTVNNTAAGAMSRVNGVIVDESPNFDGKVSWNIGTATGAHVFPFGKSLTSYNPFTYTYTTGNAGIISVSTYGTDALNAPLPAGVTSIPQQGSADNFNKAVDRFWKVTSSVATATTGTMVFGFPTTEAPTNNSQLRAQRHNGTTWAAPITGQTATATSVTAPGVGTYGTYGVFDQTPLPVIADFIPTSASICTGESITFTDQSTGSITSWTWSFGGGATNSTAQNPTIQFNSAGTFDVSLTVTDGLTNDTKTVTGAITVSPTPSIFVNNANICPGQSATLTANPSIAGGDFLWTPDGETTASITKSPSSTTMYNVTYTLNGCSNTGGGTIFVGTTPTATISGGGAICPGETATVQIDFTGGSPWNVTYTDGTTPVTVNGITSNPYTFTTGNAATYTLTNIDNGCGGTVSGSATVSHLDGVTVSNVSTTCNGANTEYTVSFTISGGDPGSYQVTGGSGTLSGNVFTSDPIASGASYNFIANDQNDCTPQTVTGSVTCGCVAEATLTGDTTICTGGTATLSISFTGTAPYSITINDGSSDNVINNINTATYDTLVTASGTYTLTAMSDAICTGSFNGSATVDITSPVSVSNLQEICDAQGNTYTVSFDINDGDPATYSVTGGTGTLSGNTFVSDPITSNTAYSFVVDDQYNCSPVTVSGNVNCTCPASATISGNSTICEGQQALLTIVFSGQAPFSVTINDGANDNVLTGIIAASYDTLVTIAGTYTLSVMSDANCTGTTSGSATIIVNPAPTVVANQPTICEGESATVTANGTPTGGSYFWSPGGQSSPMISVSPTVTTTYTVTYSLNGCSSSDDAVVTVINTAAPVISANGFELTSSIATGNQWYKDGNSIPGANNQTYIATANGTYTAKVSANGCESPFSNAIVVSTIGLIEKSLGQISFYPNPTSGWVKIEMTNEMKNSLTAIEVMDLEGRTLFSADKYQEIDLTNFERGVYVVRVQFGDQAVVRKITKQ